MVGKLTGKEQPKQAHCAMKKKQTSLKNRNIRNHDLMKTQLIRFLTTLALCASVHRAAAQGTAFTYQGRLDINGNPANGSYDLSFSLYKASSGGGVFAGPLTNSATGVTNGLFTVG